MAKAKQTTKENTTSTEVAVIERGAALPAFLKDYAGPTGQEGIDVKDVTIPRIKIGQGTSDEVKDKTVPEGALFLNVDGSVLAQPGEELEVVIVARATEYILWRDRKDGGGIFARAPKGGDGKHHWNKPGETFTHKLKGLLNVSWTTGETVEGDGLGEWGSENPDDKDSGIAATKHHNFVVYLPAFGMVASMSLARTSAKVARTVNAMLLMGSAPIFARVLKVKTVDESKDQDTWKQFKFRPAGYVDEATFEHTRQLFERFAAEGFTVDQSDEDVGEGAPVADEDKKF